MSGPIDTFKQGLAELYASGDFTDFEIVCGQRSIRVHKAVICAQSRYFRAPCGRQYAEGNIGRIVLKAIGEGDDDEESCDDPDAIKLMVDFFYHLDYAARPILPAVEKPKALAIASSTSLSQPGPLFGSPFAPRTTVSTGRQVPASIFGTHAAGVTAASTSPGSAFGSTVFGSVAAPQPLQRPPPPHIFPVAPISDGNVLMHAKVFAAAVKYQVLALQDLAASKFAAAAKASWDHPTFAEAARVAYTTTTDDFRQLRDTISSVLHQHKGLIDKVSIESVVKATPDLHFELLRMARGLPAVSANRSADEGLKCAECGIWLWYGRCQSCSTEYRGCCESRGDCHQCALRRWFEG
ncbi:hypothetical protein LTR56_015206 [Elasticomyces elasticus]|nr:hypothetical protein LTR56_015206 [Elasticomyces elasticus]KAK3644500.1 hypothetical protein LTR22_015220 [Elasticomyces elasticus]KAK4915537.1 hypothetical protein LTR49_016384 [Elasticomyces elasticus]KAK5756254.1 hypothetical protein LTS12_013678 [Elasticomyces elasticus]